MGGVNIDINKSVSAQSLNGESGFVESSAGCLHSLACAVDEISTSGTDSIRNQDPLTYKDEGSGAGLNKAEVGIRDRIQNNATACLLETELKDDLHPVLLERLSAGLDKCWSGTPSERSTLNPVLVDIQHDERGLNKNVQSRYEPDEPHQEDGLFLLGTSRTPEELECSFQKPILDRINVQKSCFDEIDPDSKRKGKEKVSSPPVDNESFLKGQDDSHESVESTNSKWQFSVGKRAACFEMDTGLGCSKRIKKLSDEVYFAKPFGHGRSFFNWMANVTKGSANSTSPERFLLLAPNPPTLDFRITDSLAPLSQKIDKDPGDGMGFESFVKALYRPGLQNIQTSATAFCNDQQEVDQVTIDPSSHLGHQARNNREGFKVLQAIPLSSYRNKDCPYGDFSPENFWNSTSSNSLFRSTPQHYCNEHRNVLNGVSSSSSAQNGFMAVPSTSTSRFSSTGSEILGSSWIARLCSKSSRKIFESNTDKSSIPKRVSLFNYEHVPQIRSAEEKCKENCYLFPSEDPKEATGDQEKTASLSDTCFPDGSYKDHKVKCKLNPIVASPTLKKLEPITSVFARRLDALRQIKSFEDANDKKLNLMCNFCGMSGHDITICPEIISSERDDLLKNNRSCDWLEVPGSLCIRCFRLNHWAVSCPYFSVKCKQPGGSVSLITPFNLDGEWKNGRRGYSDHSKFCLDKDVGQGKFIALEGPQCGERPENLVGDTNPTEMRNSLADVQNLNPNWKNFQRDTPRDGNSHY